MDIYSTIKQLCAQNGTSIAALEKRLNLGNGTIRRWDTTPPSADKLIKVADYFMITTDELTGRNITKNEESHAQNNTERRLLLLARKAMDIPENQREDIIKMFEKTIDVYLNAKGIKGDD